MTKKIDCTECNGFGKRLIKKDGKTLMKNCRTCGGKGKTPAPTKTSKKTGSKKTSAAEMHADPQLTQSGKKLKMSDDQRLAKDTIEERAAFFGCPGKVKEIRKGPVITLYEFAPAKTTRIKRLASLQEDLALALSAEAVMVRRVPGKDVVGIEISNESSERQNVAFRASLQYVKEAKQRGMELPMNLGTDPFGEPIVDDLATMPHLLIAGSTGSGKSVSLNCLISSLLTVCSPQELEFYMIDPKGVELTHYNGIPHMKEPMVTSPHYAKHMLEQLTREMRRRLNTLTFCGVRDIKEYNAMAKKEGKEPLPRIVLIVDELGDLMMQDRREFTRMFAEISQIARATGIHMVCATQRPSVDVLSGKIKVNFPARMAFKVTSSTDSRTIVHKKGAEGLLGRGDMLYLSPTRSTVVRIHAPWVPLDDVKMLSGKIKAMEEARVAEEKRKQAEAEARVAAERAKNAGPPRILEQGQTENLEIDLAWAQQPPKSSTISIAEARRRRSES